MRHLDPARLPSALLLIPAALVGLAGCGEDPTDVPEPAVDFRTSFEQDRAGFQVDYTDVGDPQVEWSVERTTELASDGNAAMRIRIANLNDQSKVWIERAFGDLEADASYDVDVTFDVASADYGINLWTLFTDADPTSPDVWADLQDDAFTTDTDTGASQGSGPVWDTRSASFTVETDGEGSVHVAIGVWGTYEVTRSYFIDDVRVTIAER